MTEQMIKMITFEQYLKELLKLRFRRKVQITFDSNKTPSLVFADGVQNRTKQAAMALVAEAYKEEGGEVKFFPEKAFHVDGMPE